jgi:hypothetical protein
MCRNQGTNPDVPQWIAEDYFQSIRGLAQLGSAAVLQATDSEVVRAILSVIAIEKGLRSHAKYLLAYSEEELMAIEAGIW